MSAAGRTTYAPGAAEPGRDRMSRTTGERVRSWLALVLVIVGSLLAPVAVVGSYVRNELVDTDRFVNLVSPLAVQEDIQTALVDAVTREILVRADEVQPGLVTKAQVDELARQVVSSPEFATIWEQVVRETHPQLQQVLLGRDTDLVRSSGGRVVLQLGELARRVQQQLVAAGLEAASRLELSEADWTLELFQSEQLAAVQDATQLIQDVVPWVVAGALAAFAVAIAVSSRRANTLAWAGTGILVGAAVVLLGLAFARWRYLDDAARVVDRDAAAAAYEQLLDPLMSRLVLWLGVGVVLIVVGPLLAWRRRRSVGAPWSGDHWLGRLSVELAAVAVAVGAAVLILWNDPSLATIAVIAGLVSAVTVGVLLLGGRAGRAFQV